MTDAKLHRQFTRNPPLAIETMSAQPLLQLQRWVDDARAAAMVEPTAMVLATVDADGCPSARVVLMRSVDTGVCFYTNYSSRKGQALAAHPQAAATFWWDRLERSVRVEGRVEKISRAQSRQYFSRRPRGSQIAAFTSHQSRPMTSRPAFEDALAANAARFESTEVPCPEHWGGYRLVPEVVEFWQGRDNRAHDRIAYRREAGGERDGGDTWRLQRLQP